MDVDETTQVGDYLRPSSTTTPVYMRLLFVTPYYKPAYVYGGPVRSIPSLCEALAQDGCEVSVYTTNAAGADAELDVPTASPVDVDGVDVTYFEQRSLGTGLFFSSHRTNFFYAPELRRRCRDRIEQFDLAYIYSMWYYTSLAAGAECREASVPYVASPRTGLMKWPMQKGALKKKLYYYLFGKRHLEGAAAVHYTTMVERQESEDLGFSAPGLVVPNGVDFSEFDQLPLEGAFRRRLGLDDTTPLLLFLGRVQPRKGLDVTLDALAAVRQTLGDVQLAVVGPIDDDEYEQRLQDQIEALDLTDAVHFTGYLDGEARLHALVDADLFVLTSHTENFAMAAVEAMACEMPVLLSEHVGVAANAEAAGAGAVVSLDPTQTAEAMHSILSDPDRRREMGARGARHVRDLYTPSHVARQMKGAFQRITDEN